MTSNHNGFSDVYTQGRFIIGYVGCPLCIFSYPDLQDIPHSCFQDLYYLLFPTVHGFLRFIIICSIHTHVLLLSSLVSMDPDMYLTLQVVRCLLMWRQNLGTIISTTGFLRSQV